ncbi:helix-loop-helix DNA-binding domain-containing protein [Xylariales sp. AK1849]|nr:helix-loop-helix DNA-binding domain-containing protein [Xylariales sp. AK1849]
MDTDVLQNIDLFPVANSKAFDSIIDNSSSCLRQLSSSFWDNLDSTTTSNPTKASLARIVQESKTSPRVQATKKSPRPVKVGKSGLKRSHTPERKRSKTSQDSSALDCCDYWLRFDSDDDSLERLGDYDSQTSRRTFGSIQESPRIGRVVGQADDFKLALPSRTEDWLEDSALDHALSSEEDSFSMALDEDFFKRDSAVQTPDAGPERLYSTPLSWETPQPGLRTDSYFNVNPSFNDPERQRLLAIAMGSGLAPTNGGSQRPPSMDFTFDMHHSPLSTSDAASNPPEPRRKNSYSKTSRSNSFRSGQTTPNEVLDKPKEKPRNSERAAHNDIERKYRTNLKDRIAELREAIPSLRSIPEDHDDDGSPVPVSRAPKVSKGTVLTKATEYIHQLERRNRSMAHKNDELLRRLQAFEQLLGASPAPTWQPQGYGTAVFNPTRYSS